MGNLILKDILIQKKIFILLIICSLTLFITAKNSIDALYPFISTFTTYAFVTNSFYNDEKAEIMLNSLPINKINIVISKYLSSFIFTIIGIVILSIIVIFTKYIGIFYFFNTINIRIIPLSLIIVILLNCVLIPIYFKYGYLKSRYITIILFIGVSFIFLSLSKISTNNFEYIIDYLNNISQNVIKYILVLICCIVFIISIAISCKIYKNKDL